ncbi:MAG: hypothetical protein AB7T27_00730 [Kiritimatiellia bacterium]
MKRSLVFLTVFMLAAGAARAVDLHGFADVRAGVRTQTDPNQEKESLGELRLQLDVLEYAGPLTLQLRSDFLYDWVLDEHDIDLETGEGAIDLREANVSASPVSWADLKAGRQILTWGTGDLLFINDMFPKDWNSFFIGRDEEYLKAPSDALKLSLFPSWANIDVVYTPRFDHDRYISGDRISFWNAGLGARSGQDAVVEADIPDEWFEDDEISVRVSRNVKGYELAVYGHEGFWKSPAGSDMATGRAIFPELGVYGASLRGQFMKGIANLEAGYYDSRDDCDGDDPMIRNSETRLMAGYQQELMQDLTLAVQYYLELMADYDAYEETLPVGMNAADEDRHVLTLRLTQQLLNQNLMLSFFAFYSPSDEDAYLRPSVSYKATDDWKFTLGGNVFMGSEDYTFFGQFEDNNNVYASARYSF